MEAVDSPWIAARSFGVQLHDSGEALVLIHSHANSEKARACISTVTYNTVLKGFTMGKRAKEVFSTFEVLK